MDERPRILVATCGLPYPPSRSGAFSVLVPLLQSLSRDHDVDLLCGVFDSDPTDPRDLETVVQWCRLLTFQHRSRPMTRARDTLFRRMPPAYHLYSRREFDRDIRPLIAPHLASYRAILVHDPHLAPLIGRIEDAPQARKVFFATDDLTLFYSRSMRARASLLRRLYDFNSWAKLRRTQPKVYSMFDAVVHVSFDDSNAVVERWPWLRSRVHTIPLGVDLTDYAAPVADPGADPPRLLFTGNMNYPPNREAVQWFHARVFPLLRRRHPTLAWDVVGRDADRFIRINDPGVTVHSSVPAMDPYLRAATLVLSPLQIGTGVKNKVIEAMGMGKVVVGSALSFEGIPIRAGRHALVAETPAQYVEQIGRMLGDPDQRTAVGRRAHGMIREHMEMSRVVQQWRQLLEPDAAPTSAFGPHHLAS